MAKRCRKCREGRKIRATVKRPARVTSHRKAKRDAQREAKNKRLAEEAE